MNSDETPPKPSVPPELVNELAASGALCPECGGLCVPTITVAIIATVSMRNAGVTLPWCDCTDCRVCEPLREAVHRLITKNDTTNSRKEL